MYQEPRTPAQQTAFEAAMAGMHCLYAHDHTNVARIEYVPPGAVNDAAYLTKAWCHFEITAAGMKNQNDVSISFVVLGPDGRRPAGDEPWRAPVTPQRYAQLLGDSNNTGLRLSKEEDRPVLRAIQAKLFETKAATTVELDLSTLHASELDPLVEALPHYHLLDKLILGGSPGLLRGEDDAARLAAALSGTDGLGKLALIVSDCDLCDGAVRGLRPLAESGVAIKADGNPAVSPALQDQLRQAGLVCDAIADNGERAGFYF